MFRWSDPPLISACIVVYLVLLGVIAWLTRRGTGNANFFLARRSSHWLVVSFGMIGATLSGITFTSIPGGVGGQGATPQFTYLQLVGGYVIGYVIIAFVLLPLYYRSHLTSIYQYVRNQLGITSSRTAAACFLISRLLISSLRLLLATSIVHQFVFRDLGVSFETVVAVALAVIWLYTFCGGLGTIIWTDVFQTIFMLLSAVVTVSVIAHSLGGWIQLTTLVNDSQLSNWFLGDDWSANSRSLLSNLVSGALLTICMTGLDQDMMQKNLSCRTLRQAQANMLVFAVLLVAVNLLFLWLGAALYLYGAAQELVLPAAADMVYPAIAFEHLGGVAPLLFSLGIIAATCSSADSTLTALTTSTCVDFLGQDEQSQSKSQLWIRFGVHLAYTIATFVIVIAFNRGERSMIDRLLITAAYTYGPILALFLFGWSGKRQIRAVWVPVVCVLAPTSTWLLAEYRFFIGWNPGYLVILVNAGLTLLGLYAISVGARSAFDSEQLPARGVNDSRGV